MLRLIPMLLAVSSSVAWGQTEGQDQPQSRLNAFNPSVTVFHNSLWRLDNKSVTEVENGNAIRKDDRFLLRETEVDLRASVDPYADGVLIAALEQELPGDFETHVEEGYVVIKSLPFGFWEEPPLGTKIKLGRFLTSLGRHNRLHTHDLPQPQRGVTFENFIDDHSYGANGASLSGFLPSFGDSALTLTLEFLQGGELPLAEGGDERPAFLGNLSWFNTFSDVHNVDIAAIAHYAANDRKGKRGTELYSLDFMYKWKPLRQGEYQSFILAGQMFYARQEFEVGTNRAFGWFAYAQYQIDRRWYAGVRYDGTELLENRDDDASRVGPYITCYISEFLRFRVAYEHTWSDDDELDDLKTLLFEINVVFGAHPPHPYWVNF